MTEDQIEREVERQTNAIDAAYMADRMMTENEYYGRIAKLARWAEQMEKEATTCGSP